MPYPYLRLRLRQVRFSGRGLRLVTSRLRLAMLVCLDTLELVEREAPERLAPTYPLP